MHSNVHKIMIISVLLPPGWTCAHENGVHCLKGTQNTPVCNNAHTLLVYTMGSVYIERLSLSNVFMGHWTVPPTQDHTILQICYLCRTFYMYIYDYSSNRVNIWRDIITCLQKPSYPHVFEVKYFPLSQFKHSKCSILTISI